MLGVGPKLVPIQLLRMALNSAGFVACASEWAGAQADFCTSTRDGEPNSFETCCLHLCKVICKVQCKAKMLLPKVH